MPAKSMVKTIDNGHVPERIANSLLPLAIPLDSVTLDPDNAKLHGDRSIEVIADSLRTYGQKKPVVVRKETMVVVAGNGTVEAARKLGWKRIAANVESMTDDEAMGYALADNKTAEESEWNWEVVKRQTALLEELGHATVGWSMEDIAQIRAMDFEPLTPYNKVPTPPEKAVTRINDIWKMGDHRLMCADAADPAAVKRLMMGRKAMLMATDPPYGVDFDEAKFNPRAKAWAGVQGDKRQGKVLDNFLQAVLAAWLPTVDEQSGFYFWSAPMQEGAAAAEAIRASGLHIQAQIIWKKNVLVLGQADYHWMHETCWYAFHLGKSHRWYGERNKTTVWEVDKIANSDYLHPMQKPVELYEIPMEHHTVAGDIVAEPFAGSGTQYVAAQKMARVCYGMEIDPVYCDVTLQRMADFTGVDPVRQDGKRFSDLVRVVRG